MRIGIFTETYTPYISGLVTSEVMLKNALEKQGHDVYVVTANLESFKYEYNEKEKVLKIPGLPTGIYDSRLTSIYPVRAVNKIKSWNLDVIHSQTEFAIGTFARLFAKQYNIPLVHTYHTLYEDYVHYITKGYFDKSSKKIVEYLSKFYCETTATELIVPTNKIYKLFKEKYKFEKNIHIIPTGIETERFYKENIDSKQVDDLRRSLGIVLQDTNLFTGTVMDNIRYGKLDATDEEVYNAAKIANALAEVFIEQVPEYFNLNNAKVYQEASVPTSPSNVNHVRDIAIAGIAGFAVSVLFVVLVSVIDDTIKSSKDIEDGVGLAVLAELPDIDFDK